MGWVFPISYPSALGLKTPEIAPHLPEDDLGDVLALQYREDLQPRLELGGGAKTVCGAVLTDVDEGDGALATGQVGGDVFQVGELHIGNQQQVRRGAWFAATQLIEVTRAQGGAAAVIDA